MPTESFRQRVIVMTEVKNIGISRTTFITGLIIAILASSLISVLAVTQSGLATGPKGDKGDAGTTGAQGQQGSQGIQGVQGPAGILSPDYDSGWVLREDRLVVDFTHNLGTSDVFVYVFAKWYRNWTGSGGPMVHQFFYGGDRWGTMQGEQDGFYWAGYTENNNTISVQMLALYPSIDELRVLIWRLP